MGLQIRSNQNEPWAYMWFKEKRKGNLNKLSIFLLNATWRKKPNSLSEFVFAQQNILTGTSKYRITCSVCTVLCIIYLCDSCIPLTASLLNHWLFRFLTLTTFVSDGQKSHRLKWGKCGEMLGLWVMFTSSWSGAVVTNDSMGIEGSDFQCILDFLLVLVCNPSLSHSRVINNLELQINHELADCVSTGYGLDSGKQVLKVLTFKNGKRIAAHWWNYDVWKRFSFPPDEIDTGSPIQCQFLI